VTLLNRLFVLVAVALSPSIVVLMYNQNELYETQLKAIDRDILQTAVQVAAEQEQATEAVRELLLAISTIDSVRYQNADACNSVLTTLAPQYPNYEFLGVADRNGVRFCSSATPFPGRELLVDRPFFIQVAKTREFSVGAHRLSGINKVHILDFGAPYFDVNGDIKGIVYAGLALNRMIERLMAHPRHANGELIVADRKGVVIASAPDPSWIGKMLPDSHLSFLDLRSSGTAELPGLDGVVRLFGYVPVSASTSHGIYVAYGLEKSTALAYTRASIARNAGASALGILLAAMMTIWYGRRFIRRPASALVATTKKWRQGDWSARATTGDTNTEFGALACAFNELAQTVHIELANREQTERLLTERNSEILERSAMLEAQTSTVALLATMAHRLQGCASEEEFSAVVRCFAPQILPGIPGALYFLSNSRNVLRAIAIWNDPAGLDTEFGPAQCWALTRGQIHTVANMGSEVVCGHVNRNRVAAYSCRPLVAQGETIGLLYLEASSTVIEVAPGDVVRSHDLDIFAENISLAMGNQRLRETLRSQSIRDPLTGLFNRRYLEEALELDLARARRSSTSVSLIMGDADHFKRFNDQFGHDAGDLVLKRIAEVMLANIRKGDVACRYGGEEFIVVLPGADLGEAVARAQVIREEIGAMSLTFSGQSLGPVTISLGVATFPLHVDDSGALIAVADGHVSSQACRSRSCRGSLSQ
jgi:diguanylate cyclase (GGDEF)-like protein